MLSPYPFAFWVSFEPPPHFVPPSHSPSLLSFSPPCCAAGERREEKRATPTPTHKTFIHFSVPAAAAACSLSILALARVVVRPQLVLHGLHTPQHKAHRRQQEDTESGSAGKRQGKWEERARPGGGAFSEEPPRRVRPSSGPRPPPGAFLNLRGRVPAGGVGEIWRLAASDWRGDSLGGIHELEAQEGVRRRAGGGAI